MLDLRSVTKKEERIAIGQNLVTLIRGWRTSTKRQHLKKTLDTLLEDKVWFVLSGGGRNKVRVITWRTTGSQTDGSVMKLGAVSEGNFDNDGEIVTGRARNIQLAHPIYLREAIAPGNIFMKGKLTQTHFTLGHPDLWPFTSAVTAITRKSNNETPRVRLACWTDDQAKLVKPERDSEWLTSSGKEESEDELHKLSSVELYKNSFLDSLKLLLLILKFGGEWPFTMITNRNHVQFHQTKTSWNYILFLFTTSLYSCISLTSVLNLLGFLLTATTESGSFSQSVVIQVKRLQFDKYWHFVFWTYIMAIYVCFWKLAILLEDSLAIQDLVTRWSLVATQMHYVPTKHIRLRVIFAMVGFSVYAVGFTFICVFATNNAPSVSGSAEVLGLFFCENMFPSIRLSRHFYLVRLFGLAFHLYTMFAARFSLILVASCAKMLENTAKAWNLRFAARFGLLTRVTRRSTTQMTVTNVSLQKLLMEHQLISSFSRHTSSVFQTALNLYLVTTGTEMVLFLYRSLAFILIPETVYFNETYLPPLGLSGDVDIRYRDTKAQRELSCLVAAGFVFFGWLVTSNNIAGCGEAILDGFKFVSRYGLIVCQNAAERNFINSLNLEFTPSLEHFLKAGSKYNRGQALGLFMWILVFSLGLLSFVPYNLQKNTIRYCDVGANGEVTCKEVKLSRIQSRPGSDSPIADLTPCPPTTAIIDLGGNQTFTKILYFEACDQSGKRFDPRCFSDSAVNPGIIPDANNWQLYPEHLTLFDCRTKQTIGREHADDCGNLAYGQIQHTVPVSVYLKDPAQGNISLRYVCCHSFANATESLQYCHGRSPNQMFYACHQKSKGRQEDLWCFTGQTPTSTAAATTTPQDTRYFECNVDVSWAIQNNQPTSDVVSHIASCRTAGDTNTRELAFGALSNPTECYSSGYTGPAAYAYGNAIAGSGQLYSCFSTTSSLISTMERDDCNNLSHARPGRVRKDLIILRFLTPNGDRFRQFCCYNYTAGVVIDVKSFNLCHTVSEEQAINKCNSRMETDHPPTVAEQIDCTIFRRSGQEMLQINRNNTNVLDVAYKIPDYSGSKL